MLLNQQGLDLVLNGEDLVLDAGSVVRSHRSSNHRTGNSTGSTKGSLGGNKNVRHVLVLTQKRQVQQNLNRLSVSSHDDELRNTSVQGFGGLVGTFLELTKVLRLLHDVKDLLSETSVSERKSFRVGHFL